MFGLGVGELTLIFLIFLVLFGARKLPEIGDGLGKGILSFRRSLKQPDEITTPAQNLTEQDDKSNHDKFT